MDVGVGSWEACFLEVGAESVEAGRVCECACEEEDCGEGVGHVGGFLDWEKSFEVLELEAGIAEMKRGNSTA